MATHGELPGIFLGPRTTVWSLLAAYPFLAEYLAAYHPELRRLGLPDDRGRWSRVLPLGELALKVDVTWRQLVRDLRDEVQRVTGSAPSTPATVDALPSADRRVAELRAIADSLEEGGSLPALAARLAELTAGVDAMESAALDRALATGAHDTRAAADRQVEAAAAPARGGEEPAGHPLASLRGEAAAVRAVRDELGAELAALGGGASRRWREAAGRVRRLVERLSQVERRFRRERQAWFPALAIHGIEAPGALLGERHDTALESLRRLRLAAARDDPAQVVENGARLLDLLDDLLSVEEQVLAPLAERHLSDSDWAEVRQMEEAVGWALIAEPPPWPDPRS